MASSHRYAATLSCIALTDGRAFARPFASVGEANLTSLDLDHSRPLDVHRWSEHPEVHSLIDQLWSDYFSDYDPNTGRAGRRPKGHPKRQLRVLVLDLYVAWANDPTMTIGVAMSNSGYHPNSRYNALHISKTLIGLVHRAHQVGIIGFHPGSEAARRTSRIWAAAPLVDMFRKAKFGLVDIHAFPEQESIVLSLGEGHWLEYEDTPEIVADRLRVDRYNHLMHRTFIDIPSLTTPVIIMPPKAEWKRPTKFHLNQDDKFSRRIYYRGQWDLGGRLHGGSWQSLPKEWRARLFINDLPTIEDDYSGLHIALLYGLEGAKLEGEAYELDLATSMPAWEMKQLVKSLSLTMINARSEKQAFQAFRDEQETGSPLKRLTNAELSEIVEAFKKRHPAIASYMCSDQGVKLMAIDGRMTMRVIDHFTSEQVPVLSLFDSYVIDAFHAPELRSAMIAAMDAEVPGASTSFKRIGVSYDQIHAEAGDDMESLLRLPGKLLGDVVKTEGYLARRDQFYQWRSEQPEWQTHKQGSIDQFKGSIWSTY